MFDSLVYCYKLAREQALQYEIEVNHRKGKDNENVLRAIAERDIMKFIQILDEVIGEHD